MLKVKYMIKVFQINGEKIIDCLISDVGMVGNPLGNKVIQMLPHTMKEK